MPNTRSPHSDLLERLQLALATERDAGDLCRVDQITIAAALDAIIDLRDRARAPGLTDAERVALLNQHDAIAEHLGSLVSFRARKVLGCIGYGAPDHLLPAEADYFTTVSMATADLRAAWGLVE